MTEPIHKAATGDSLVDAGKKLIVRGAVLAVLVGAIAMVVIGLVVGWHAGLSFGAGVVGGLAAMAAGQAVLVAVWRQGAAFIFVMAMAGYAVGVGGVVAVLAWASRHDLLDSWWLAIGIAVGAWAYLGGAIWAHTRLRIPVFSNAKGPSGGELTGAQNEGSSMIAQTPPLSDKMGEDIAQGNALRAGESE
ncbi:MAG: hypothetical protein LBV00_05190 [Propionibacteriaceae bacterium]|jgi:hypothetical protein|nr:hypothetical protein [Propionibacteriaceae bacterium]